MTARYDFNPGDVVQLRSGGPYITYEGCMPTGEAICVWFEGDKVERRAFIREALIPAGSPAPFSKPLVLTDRL